MERVNNSSSFKMYLIAVVSFSLLVLVAQAVMGDSYTYTLKSFKGSAACRANRYFQDYDCSPAKIVVLAQGNDADAQYALGYLFYYGIGMKRDAARGKQWIRKAAERGNKEAARALKMINKKQQRAVKKQKQRHQPRPVSPIERSQQTIDRQLREFWVK